MTGDPLIDVALKLTDGATVDWDDVARGASAEDRAALDCLRELQAVGRLHTSSPPDSPLVLDSIRLNPAHDAAAPLKWGTLEIVEKIGRGAYGDVYRARDPRLGRDVALKLLRHRDDAGAESEVVREGHLLARVRHPNVVTVHGAERIDGRTGLWMELVHGATLEEELQHRGPLPPAEVIEIGQVLCSALAAVHQAGLLHRDIKAQNVIRAMDGRLVLMDFGTGAEAGGSSATVGVAGTPAYLAPEVLEGHSASRASDIYALGVLLFRLATGTLPVTGADVRAIRDAHRANRRALVHAAHPGVPRALARVIDRALATDPQSRFTGASDMLDALRKAGSAISPVMRRRRLMTSVMVISTVALVIVGSIAVIDWRTRQVGGSSVTLSRLPAFQKLGNKVNIRAPSWQGEWVTCTPAGPGAVALCRVSDGTIRAVRTPTAPTERAPAAVLSPDGGLVAYHWVQEGRGSLRVIGADGSGDRELMVFSSTVRATMLGWHAATGMLLINRLDGTDSCTELLDVVTMRRVKLRCDDELGNADLSPDERFLVFSQPRSPGTPHEDIWIRDLAAGIDRPLAQGTSIDVYPLWTPDGSGIVMGSNRLGSWGVFFVPLTNGVPDRSPQLIRDVGRSQPWLLGFNRHGMLLMRLMGDLNDVVRTTLDLSTSRPALLERADQTAFDESIRSPTWSPDGRRFAYLAGPLIGGDRIVIADADGRVERQLPAGRKLDQIRWSPDSQSLAITSGFEGSGKGVTLEILSLSDESRRTIATSSFLAYTVWAPDGKSLYYRGANKIERVDPATSAVTVVFAPTKPVGIERLASFDLSPDGQWLAVPVRTATAPCAIHIMTPGGPSQELAHFPTDCRAIAWTHDQRAVLISTWGPNWTTRLWAVPIDGGPAVSIPLDDVHIAGISVHPRGEAMLLATGNPRPDFWTLSGFARSVN